MQMQLSKPVVKRQAKLLSDFLQQDGIPIKHSRALEAMARCHGFRDWRTAEASLPDTAGSASAPETRPIESIGAVAPRNSRADDAREIFVPELARILANQIHVLDRVIVNFSCASAGPPPADRSLGNIQTVEAESLPERD